MPNPDMQDKPPGYPPGLPKIYLRHAGGGVLVVEGRHAEIVRQIEHQIRHPDQAWWMQHGRESASLLLTLATTAVAATGHTLAFGGGYEEGTMIDRRGADGG